ncbi:MAG: Transcriptional regulator [Myxococcaceae bacterium]|nr:Transcriptional regulator [Myxococcaceae bacterium]
MLRRVAIVCFENNQPLDVVGPHEAFAMANLLLRQRSQDAALYQLTLLSPDGAAVRSESGLRMLVDASLSKLAQRRGKGLDTLLVAGGRGARKAVHDPGILRGVQRVAEGARRVASVCTGAFVLAAAGLLDGKRATTHWQRCAQLAAEYPRVQVESAPIYICDGNVWTSAGVTAGIDLSLALIDADHGRALASEVARQLVVFVRRAGGQAQFSEQLAVQSAERAPLRELMSYVVDHPDAPLDVPTLARRANMSVRHFTRLFRAETGSSPAAFVERIRVETARRLLETSARSVEEVATQSGFGTPESLRRAFARRVDLSPREYRARFGAR